MKKHLFSAMLFVTCALICLCSAANAESPEVVQTESVAVAAVQEEENAKTTQPVRSTLNFSSLTLVQTYDNPNPRRQLALKTVSASGCYVYQWYSSNPDIVSVDNMGVVTALRTGYASISAYTTQGEILNCLVEVRSDIGEVTLNAGDLALEQIGTQKPLHASVAVQNPSAVQLSWVSANPEIATVDQSGVVTAVADGMTEITVYTPDGRSDSCQVYVGSSVAEFEKVDTIRTVAVVGGVAVLVTIAIIASAAQ